MPVPHDLYADLKLSKEDVQQKRTKDPLLESLINKYTKADAEVVKAETAQSDEPSDDALKKLKEKHLQVDVKIVQQLQAKQRPRHAVACTWPAAARSDYRSGFDKGTRTM